MKQVRFVGNEGRDFQQTLTKRVNEYFKSNNISRNANGYMYFKTVFMFALYLTPLVLIATGVYSNAFTFFLLWFIAGMGLAGIGLSIMHDANHGAYSKNPKVNKWMGFSLSVVGGSPVNWKIQHNVLHHSYTNIKDIDEDVKPGPLLRFSPHEPWHKYHKAQHFYAWFLYGMMTLLWITVKDFLQLNRYKKMGMLEGQRTTYKKELTYMIIQKTVYYIYILVLPLIFLNVTWWVWILGMVLMHFVAGLFLAMVFQPAHVMETCAYPEASDEGTIENNFAIHQMMTTTNFARDNRLLSWFVGGLNYQVEHHLFPNICHVHYRAISPIVKATAEEFGVPYYSKKTFSGALLDHAKMLKKLGSAAQYEA
jgi:linoleoyl-CoA desaturase